MLNLCSSPRLLYFLSLNLSINLSLSLNACLKAHAKKQLILTINGREMAVWIFFWWLVDGLIKIKTPRRPRRTLKPSKMDLPTQKTPILTPHTCLNSLLGRNGENLGSDPFLGSFSKNFGPLEDSKSNCSPFRPQREFKHVWGVKLGVIGRCESKNGVFEWFRRHLVAKKCKKHVIFSIWTQIFRGATGGPVFSPSSCRAVKWVSDGIL